MLFSVLFETYVSFPRIAFFFLFGFLMCVVMVLLFFVRCLRIHADTVIVSKTVKLSGNK